MKPMQRTKAITAPTTSGNCPENIFIVEQIRAQFESQSKTRKHVNQLSTHVNKILLLMLINMIFCFTNTIFSFASTELMSDISIIAMLNIATFLFISFITVVTCMNILDLITKKNMMTPHINLPPNELMRHNKLAENEINKFNKESRYLIYFASLNAIVSLFLIVLTLKKHAFSEMLYGPYSALLPNMILSTQMLISNIFTKHKINIDKREESNKLKQLEKLLPTIFSKSILHIKHSIDLTNRVLTIHLPQPHESNDYFKNEIINILCRHDLIAKLHNHNQIKIYMNTVTTLPDIDRISCNIEALIAKPYPHLRSTNNNDLLLFSKSAATSLHLNVNTATTDISPKLHKSKKPIISDKITKHVATATPITQITWADQRHHKIIFNSANDKCPIKAMNGNSIPQNKIFLFFPLTIDDFDGDKKAYKKFKDLAQKASVANLHGSEGIIFIREKKDKKNLAPITTKNNITFFPASKIKALGEYGDDRVYCERVTSETGEQLHIARCYKSHTHTKM